MQFKKIAFFIISVILVATGCDSKKDDQKEIVEKKQVKFEITSQITPKINLEKTQDGVVFEQFKGKAVLLNFFAMWCPPCKAEIPHLVNLKNKYKDSFEIVSLNMGEKDGVVSDAQKMQDFIKEYGINYNVSNEANNFKIAEMMDKVEIIPTMFLFDTTGKIVQKYVGIVPEEMLETDIKRAIRK